MGLKNSATKVLVWPYYAKSASAIGKSLFPLATTVEADLEEKRNLLILPI